MSESNYTPGFEDLVTGNKGIFDSEVKGFFYWLKSGFAFTLPLIFFGILALLVVFLDTRRSLSTIKCPVE